MKAIILLLVGLFMFSCQNPLVSDYKTIGDFDFNLYEEREFKLLYDKDFDTIQSICNIKDYVLLQENLTVDDMVLLHINILYVQFNIKAELLIMKDIRTLEEYLIIRTPFVSRDMLIDYNNILVNNGEYLDIIEIIDFSNIFID